MSESIAFILFGASNAAQNGVLLQHNGFVSELNELVRRRQPCRAASMITYLRNLNSVSFRIDRRILSGGMPT